MADNVILLKDSSMKNVDMTNITDIKKLEELIDTHS